MCKLQIATDVSSLLISLASDNSNQILKSRDPLVYLTKYKVK